MCRRHRITYTCCLLGNDLELTLQSTTVHSPSSRSRYHLRVPLTFQSRRYFNLNHLCTRVLLHFFSWTWPGSLLCPNKCTYIDWMPTAAAIEIAYFISIRESSIAILVLRRPAIHTYSLNCAPATTSLQVFTDIQCTTMNRGQFNVIWLRLIASTSSSSLIWKCYYEHLATPSQKYLQDNRWESLTWSTNRWCWWSERFFLRYWKSLLCSSTYLVTITIVFDSNPQLLCFIAGLRSRFWG